MNISVYFILFLSWLRLTLQRHSSYFKQRLSVYYGRYSINFEINHIKVNALLNLQYNILLFDRTIFKEDIGICRRISKEEIILDNCPLQIENYSNNVHFLKSSSLAVEEDEEAYINDFAFSVAIDNSFRHTTWFGLGLQSVTDTNSNKSIIKQLYNSYKISWIKFSFTPYPAPEIYFGEIPEIERRVYPNTVTCNIPKSYNHWGCDLHSMIIVIDNKRRIIYEPKGKYAVSFHSDSRNIYVPLEFIEFLRENYFMNYIKNHICKVYNTHQYVRFYCNSNGLSGIPSVKVVFNELVINWDISDLFIDDDDEEYSHFIFEYYHKLNNAFSFGTGLYKNYITEFDWENRTISFSSGLNFEDVHIYNPRGDFNNETVIKWMYLWNILTWGWMSLFNYLNKNKYNY